MSTYFRLEVILLLSSEYFYVNKIALVYNILSIFLVLI